MSLRKPGQGLVCRGSGGGASRRVLGDRESAMETKTEAVVRGRNQRALQQKAEWPRSFGKSAALEGTVPGE